MNKCDMNNMRTLSSQTCCFVISSMTAGAQGSLHGESDVDAFKKDYWDFPGGAVVKNPLANAGDMGLIHPWSRKIPHAAEQLSPCSTATEPMCRNY